MSSLSSAAPAVLIGLHSAPSPQSRVERIVFFGLGTLLLFGPLAFGAVESWAIFAQQAVAVGLVMLWISAWITNSRIHAQPNPLYFPWAALAVLVLLQILLRVPPYLHSALLAAAAGVTYLSIFFLANETFKFPGNVRAAARALMIFGFVLAVYSTLQAFVAPDKLLGFRLPRVASSPFGPYVNHAHYAGLMELLIPFPLLLALRWNLARAQAALYALMSFIMAASVFLCESRGGMIVVTLQIAVIGALWLRSTRSDRMLWLIPAAAVFAIFIFWLGASRLQQNLSTFRHPGVSVSTRLEIAKDTLRMAAAKPWLGWGLGSFPVVYPEFRSFYTNQVVGTAHNDYLQAFAELGVLGSLALLWFLIALYRSGWRRLDRWRADSVSAAKLAALIGASGILLHGLSDFNFHIPANAALFVALCALATVRSDHNA
jgi:O-antigen ligase